MPIPVRAPKTVSARPSPTHLPRRHGALPQMPVPRVEAVHVRQNHPQKPTLLPNRRPLRPDLRPQTPLRFAHMPEAVP